jgi:arylsulfatase A-like enzyme
MNPSSEGPAAIEFGSRELWYVSLFAGLLAGFAQVAVVAFKQGLGRDLISLGVHMVWMTPVATVGLLLVVALLLAAGRRIFPALAAPDAVIGVFAFVGTLGVSLYKGGIHPLADVLLSAGVATVLVRLLVPRMQWFLTLVRRTTPWLVGLVVASAVAVFATRALAERRAVDRLGAPAARTNIIVLVLDAVRAQNLSLYGYPRATTPELERWAKRGVLFRRAIAPSSWTLPSHASMFTGRPALQLSADWGIPLDGAYPTLAEYLRARGYMTAGFVANSSYCSRMYGLARGFIHYEDLAISFGELLASSKVPLDVINSPLVRRVLHYRDFLGRKHAETISRDFLAWLDRRPDRPFFVFLNYFDAHEPALPTPEFERRFPSSTPRRWDLYDHQLHQSLRVNESRMSPGEVETEINAYDATIAGLDRQIGALLDELDRRGVLDSTVVFITADHGELHGEHRLFGHGNSLFRWLTQVPLLILRPDGRAGVVDSFVSLRNVAGTALDLVGVENDGTFPRCSFGRLADAPSPRATAATKHCSTVTADLPNEGKAWASAYEGRFHFMVREDSLESLYDWDADPAERHDLTAQPEYRPVTDRLRPVTDSVLADPLRHFPNAGS